MADYGSLPRRRVRGASHLSGAGRVAVALASASLVVGLGTGVAQATERHTAAPSLSGLGYRHGLVPMRGTKGAKWRNLKTASAAGGKLIYGGGQSGVGVTIAPPKVYLVFWGSQWGSQSTNGSGYFTYSGDPKGLAPDMQGFFKGLGTNNELWDGTDTQYCQGVSSGSTSCPSSNTQHVGYPYGGALAGVWEDTSSAEPQTASGHAIGQEAVKAAGHFGNTTSASNRNAIYIVNSPTGTDPDNYKSQGFCAWHDYTGDSSLSGGGSVSSPYGPLAFANMPYVPDAGSGCGANFVNSPGPLDGVTIVVGHEYSEWMTDSFPAGGWTDSSGAENGDKCAWLRTGQGAAQDITLGTGRYPVQGIWANDSGFGGGCDISHPIVTNPGGNTVTVTNPGSQTSSVGGAVSLQIQASDSGGKTLTYSATGLPAGLSINSSSGLISGTPTTASTYSPTVTATDSGGASGSASFSWTVGNGGGGGIVNGGFETGSLSPWRKSGSAGKAAVTTSGPHSGTYAAMLGLTSVTNGYSSISQTFTAPSGTSTLTLWYNVTCKGNVTNDWAIATLKDNTTATTVRPLHRTCVAASGWKSVSATVNPGDSYTLTLTNHDNGAAGSTTYTKYDDVGLS